MNERVSFRTIKDEIARRIGDKVWPPGTLIPGEAALADEFGAARATVNRALQELARTGLLERKRKAGTRVALNPVRQARLSIPIVGEEIAALGQTYDYALLTRTEHAAGPGDARRLGVPVGRPVLTIACLHRADGKPYQYEDRLISLDAVPTARDEAFRAIGPNEWLVNNAPFSYAELSFLAAAATEAEAGYLALPAGQPVFVAERLTFILTRPITHVRMVHPQSHRLRTII
ncbi:GntR family transcriptional regulator [Aureimonas altamirensis]|uniref:GntR family transcriptional regulator n=1 Tax=Aureimonas altamirensis TaxID=370622 RepID=UPI001E57F675|nr:GntR family transcriptional regulator [Aureimonas altamirensis]UHD46211.1 GntR family transcriptional regulator [Aureimonas altamirensis]